MKVSVCAQVYYNYEVDVPEGTEDIKDYCENADRAWYPIVLALRNKGYDFHSSIVSIYNNDTDEAIYVQ